jgi:RNA polymerase sigma factor (sigma-70 family)
MNKSSILTKTTLDELLRWLDRDRDQAGQKYEQIRRALIKVFAARGCYHAEDLADETLTRVAHKAGALEATYKGNPSLFFYGVAKNVYHEYLRNMSRSGGVDVSLAQDRAQRIEGAAIEGELTASNEARLECLTRCLRALSDDQREIVTKYYEDEKRAKIDNRKALAERYRLSINALRLKASRLRQSLRQCVLKCLESNT